MLYLVTLVLTTQAVRLGQPGSRISEVTKMEYSVELILAWILIIGGFVLLISPWIRVSKKMPKMNPFVGVIGGALIIMIGGIAGGYIPNPFVAEETPQATITTIECPTFDVTPSAGTIALLNSAKDGFTIPARANTTAYTLIQEDNATAWANPTCTFDIVPEPYLGADNDDLATIYYEVYDAEIAVDTSTDSYKLFTKTGGNRQVIWTGDGTKYVDGSSTMQMTGNVTLTLTFTVTQDSMSRIENTYDPVSVYVKFSNKCGWSETYKVDFILVGTFA